MGPWSLDNAICQCYKHNNILDDHFNVSVFISLSGTFHGNFYERKFGDFFRVTYHQHSLGEIGVKMRDGTISDNEEEKYLCQSRPVRLLSHYHIPSKQQSNYQNSTEISTKALGFHASLTS